MEIHFKVGKSPIPFNDIEILISQIADMEANLKASHSDVVVSVEVELG